MDADIQPLEQILNCILHAEPADKAQAALLDQAYKGIKSAIAAMEQFQAQ